MRASILRLYRSEIVRGALGLMGGLALLSAVAFGVYWVKNRLPPGSDSGKAKREVQLWYDKSSDGEVHRGRL